MYSEGTTQQPNGSALRVWWFKPFPSFCSHYIGIKSSFVKFKKQPKRDAAFAKMALFVHAHKGFIHRKAKTQGVGVGLFVKQRRLPPAGL